MDKESKKITISSSRLLIETPVQDLNIGDVVQIFDKDDSSYKEIVIVVSSNVCTSCPLFSGKICQYFWEDENGIRHGACESIASLADPNAKDIRFDSFERIMEDL